MQQFFSELFRTPSHLWDGGCHIFQKSSLNMPDGWTRAFIMHEGDDSPYNPDANVKPAESPDSPGLQDILNKLEMELKFIGIRKRDGRFMERRNLLAGFSRQEIIAALSPVQNTKYPKIIQAILETGYIGGNCPKCGIGDLVVIGTPADNEKEYACSSKCGYNRIVRV